MIGGGADFFPNFVFELAVKFNRKWFIPKKLTTKLTIRRYAPAYNSTTILCAMPNVQLYNDKKSF